MLDRTDAAVETPTHLSKLFGRDSLYMVLWGVQLLAAAGLTPVITRVMGIGEFGVVASAMALMQVTMVLGGFGLQTAIQRQFARPGGDLDARKLLSVTLLLACAFTAAALLSSSWWSGALGFEGSLTPPRLAIVWAGLSVATSAALALLRSQDRLGAFAAVSLVQSVVAEAASLGFVAVLEPTSSHFLVGRVLAQLAATVLALLMVRPRSFGPGDRTMARSALRYSLPLVPAALSSFVLTTADRLIIQSMMDNDAVARYQVAYNIASVPILLLSVLQAAWLPRFFSVPDAQDRAALVALTRNTLYRLLVPAVLGLAVGAPLVIRLWAPPNYEPGKLSLVASLVIITAVPFAAQVVASLHLTTAGRTGTIALAVAVAAGVNVVLNLLLIPHFGLEGSAFSTLAAYAACCLVLQTSVRRTGSIPSSPLSLRIALALACLASIAVTLLPYNPVVLLLRAVGAAVCVVVFVHLVVSTRRQLI
ncbi:lipopolysaccharide biosynthesis protein [Winogradskya humida]|uniref:O-antigen/teichoic acid export membrane protein n=1 Tax=Winogradskya humida TaxID=113566 RepID=A0ABQ3ZEM2_9ACTN|nr:oligosaccharide flippase family protein [Actinoplanes humidus]GIE17014.1 hypothetical protein Ahu01nite_001160 [Actinoplanes humidus]